MKLFGKDGIEMMDVKSIEEEAGRLVIRGKMMGAMATTIYVTPLDLWEAYRLLALPAKARLPMLLFSGWRQKRKAARST